jgi:hypothetical protein
MKVNRLKKRSSNIILFYIGILFSISVHSQNESNKLGLFVRVYNLKSKKVEKGRVLYIKDSVLGIKNTKTIKEVSFVDIGKIKTKRSTGHNVLVGSLLGGALGTIIGAATSKEETKTGDGGWLFGEYEYTTGYSTGTGAAIGAGTGITAGAIAGLGISAFKNSKTYLIDGDMQKWIIFKDMILVKME